MNPKTLKDIFENIEGIEYDDKEMFMKMFRVMIKQEAIKEIEEVCEEFKIRLADGNQINIKEIEKLGKKPAILTLNRKNRVFIPTTDYSFFKNVAQQNLIEITTQRGRND